MADNSMIEKEIEELHSHLNRMIELYNEDHIDEAGSKTKNIFAKIINALLEEAGLSSNLDAVKKIDSLYQNKWLTDEENNHLHKLRKIRNLFVHDDDTESGNDAEKQQMLEYYTNNFQQCINYCQKDIEWFEKKIYDVKQGIKVNNSWNGPPQYGQPNNQTEAYNSGGYQNNRPQYIPPRTYNNNWRGDYRNTAPYSAQAKAKAPKNKSFIVLIPAVISVLISLAFIWFFRQTNLLKIAEKYGDDVYSKAGIAIFIGSAAVILIGGIFLYELLPQITAGIVMGALTYSLTASDLCTVLMVVLTVLLTTRYSRTLRYVFFWIIYVFLIIVIASLSHQFIQHFFCPEGSKTEDVFLKIVLPIGAYILVFFLGHFTVMRYLHPFRKTLGNNRMPLNTPVSLLLTGALGYLLYGTYNERFNAAVNNGDKKVFVSYFTAIIAFTIIMYLIYLICSLFETKDE